MCLMGVGIKGAINTARRVEKWFSALGDLTVCRIQNKRVHL